MADGMYFSTRNGMQLTDSNGTPSKERILSVREVNHIIFQQLQTPLLFHLQVRGQVSGLRPSPNGHLYFDLKDNDNYILPCRIWKSTLNRLQRLPSNGDQIVACGNVNMYEVGGTVQLVLDSFRPDGQSELYLQFLELKDRLTREGLFDPARKKPLPRYPKKVAMITSREGAVFHDVCTVAQTRDPGIPILLIPSPVQGKDAAKALAACMRFVQRLPGIDVVILGRGGGSMEDLWCFNDEALVRAVAECRIPVVTGIGHETDTTLCDFAADLRAATPSQAAEFVFPDRSGTRQQMENLTRRLNHGMDILLQGQSLRLTGMRNRLTEASPVNRLERLIASRGMLVQRLNGILDNTLMQTQFRFSSTGDRLDGAMERRMEMASGAFERAAAGLQAQSPEARVQQLGIVLDRNSEHLRLVMDQQFNRTEARMEALRTRMQALNPAAVLERGYAFVTGGEHVVTSSREAPDHMVLHFRDGEVAVQKEKKSTRRKKTEQEAKEPEEA